MAMARLASVRCPQRPRPHGATLHERHRLLGARGVRPVVRAIPAVASVGLQNQNILHPRACFMPSGGIEGDTSFRVILWMQSGTRLGVLVFSSVSGCWSVSMSTSSNDLARNGVGILTSGFCAYDCFYWKLYNMSTLIKLDMNSMQFCTVDLPPGHAQRGIVIVESGESKVAMFSMSYEATSLDYYTFSQIDGEMSHEWHMMSTVPLPADYDISPCGLEGGYIFLEGIPIEPDGKHPVYFSLEIKSFKIERVSTTSFGLHAHPYFCFPSSMSPIRIEGYGEE